MVEIQPTTKLLARVFAFDAFTARAAAFRVFKYRDCKSDDDLFCNKALKASFFGQKASLSSRFHQSVVL